MNGLDTHARAILDAARHADIPTHRQRERSARAMALRFGFGTAALTTSTSGWAALAAAKVWIPAMLVVASGAGGAVWFGSKGPPPATSTFMAAPLATSEAPAATAVDPQMPKDEPAGAVSDVTPLQQASGKPARTKENAATTSNHLQEETALLAEVNGALGAGQLRGALDLLDTYDRRYPNGILREESSATRVVVMCQLDHGPRAAALAKHFLAQHGSSPLVPRVQRACSGQIP